MRPTPILFVAAIATMIAACSPSKPNPAPTPDVGQNLAPTPTASDTASANWTRYENRRFGYAIDVPPGFVSDQAPQNNDGRVFHHGDSVLTIFDQHNVLDSTFDDQIAQMGEGLSDVRLKTRTATTWRATARTSDGWIVHLLIARSNPGDLIVARFSYPRSHRKEFAADANRALDSLMLLGKVGPLSFRYPAGSLMAVDSTIKLPPDYDETLKATKLLPVDRAARLGKPGCSYGLSGESEPCSADKEAGLSFALADAPIATLRSSFAADRVEPSKLAGRNGFRVTQGAEGEGANYSFIPDGKRTVIVEQLWRSDADKADYDGVLSNLSLKSD